MNYEDKKVDVQLHQIRDVLPDKQKGHVLQPNRAKSESVRSGKYAIRKKMRR